MASQQSVNRALSRVLQEAWQQGRRNLEASSRFIIFSDHHKGARTGADDFLGNELTYLAALDHYYKNGYTLIVLGDAEELWEEDAASVLGSYKRTMESEARFYPDRYIRIFGNHDIEWRDQKQVEKHLHPYFPSLESLEGIVLEFNDGADKSGQLFLVHGNQGTLFSDRLARYSAPLVRIYWRAYQIVTGRGRTTPATDACLRGRHDTQMYAWASQQGKMLLIAGHTHRPVWGSRTHLEKLLSELDELQRLPPSGRPPNYEDEVARLKAEIAERVKKYPPCEDTIKPKPSYFNTGCCCFADGDITGIELEGGQIRLVKWGGAAKSVLEKAYLSDIFFLL